MSMKVETKKQWQVFVQYNWLSLKNMRKIESSGKFHQNMVFGHVVQTKYIKLNETSI